MTPGAGARSPPRERDCISAFVSVNVFGIEVALSVGKGFGSLQARGSRQTSILQTDTHNHLDHKNTVLKTLWVVPRAVHLVCLTKLE